ncbi:hypothetical protein F3Y22_tig00110577pilonHSYRG00314 [Hibiscus syriacus]|uniref:Uncharacterized protein n=1 Tax=Hibiscus syriacus TaxID=106335 RepID=A0A6A3A8W0_HIBSY|nr:hypothetical protein F3Y22_tig00110577pilonHSYRG00314 [Hibiscus syriacus]
MSMNGKLSGSNGRLSANSRLKKAKETNHGHGSNSSGKWKRNFLFLWLLAFVCTGIIWFFFSFNGVALEINGRTLDSCEEKARILLQQFNVSRNQFHALASFFYESDQIASLECAKHSGSKRPSSDDVACVLKVMCSEKQDFKRQQMWAVKNHGT